MLIADILNVSPWLEYMIMDNAQNIESFVLQPRSTLPS